MPKAKDQRIRFNRDIRPILSENCFLCHGPDKNHRKAKLRLDDPEVALAKKAVVPGDVAKSELVKRIFTTDP
ncbi:MAG TPA: c-type cytochrome domain-containing protein, partial [Tepidisphaeraceae bacterium]